MFRQIAALSARLDALEHRITMQADIEKIRTIAFSYGYFMVDGLYDQAKQLLSPNIVSCEISGYGVWKVSKYALTFNTIHYNEGDWTTHPRIRCVNPKALPDAPSTFHHPFPESGVVPFHDPHPVTGKPIP